MIRIVLTMILWIVLPAACLAAPWQAITPQQVATLMHEGSGLWLIDVRGPRSFETVHIEGSVNIPSSALVSKQFPKQKILVVTDNALGQQQAKEAAALLVKNGQKRVYVLIGGIAAWEKAKLPLVGDGLNWPLRQVMPEELVQAMDDGVKVDLFDLRDEDSQLDHPLFDATLVEGEHFDERLLQLTRRLKRQDRKSPGVELKQPPVTVVVLPAAVDGQAVYRQHFWRLAGDVRILNGAYLIPRSKERHSVGTSEGGCATCPGG